MSDDPNKHLSDAEATMLRSLADAPVPSAGLEDRVVAELKRRGRLRAQGGPIMAISKTVVAAAILGAVFVGGFAAGNRKADASKPEAAQTNATTTETAAAQEPQFMLLMYSAVDATEAAPIEPAPADPAAYNESIQAIIAEYRDWAMARADEGRLVSAEKLSDAVRVMTGRGENLQIAQSVDTNRMLGGYFLITAPSLDAAIEVAKSHPHLKYGGEVEVRPVENTSN